MNLETSRRKREENWAISVRPRRNQTSRMPGSRVYNNVVAFTGSVATILIYLVRYLAVKF